MGRAQSFNIFFRGIEYTIDIVKYGKNTSVFVEHANSEDDVEEDILLKLTEYLIKEGFVDPNFRK